MKSMTGYGRGFASSGNSRVSCEIRGVNGRYFDARLYMSSEHMGLEPKLRRLCKDEVKRGRIEVFFKHEDPSEKQIDEFSKAKLGSFLDEIISFGNSRKIDVSLSAGDVLRLLKHVGEELNDSKAEDSELSDAYVKSLNEALGNFAEMRKKEGDAIEKELEDIMTRAALRMKSIEERLVDLSAEHRDKLKERVSKLLDGREVNELSLLNEIAIIADKSDVREEVFRFLEHKERFISLLGEDVIGKKLDFLIQEMNREVNTIGSKIGDVDLSNAVVDIKALVEQAREQIQNVE